MAEKRILIGVLLFLSLLPLTAQISPVYERHNNYEQFINPAITGRDRYPYINLSHKNYWLGTENPPNSTCLGASMRLGQFDFYTPSMMLNKTRLLSKSRMGFGAFVMRENNGPLDFYTGMLTYAYYLPLSNYSLSELSFGISVEVSQYNIDETQLDPFDEGDPELAGINDRYLFPESGFGVYYHNEQFHIGLSVNELFQSKLPYSDIKLIDNRKDFFLQTGYKFYLPRFELEPIAFVAKINNRPIYFYNQLKLYYLNYNWIAIAYKSTNTLTASAGFRVGRIFFAYAYEANISRMQKYFGGSHEIMLGLNIGLFEPEGIKKTIKNRR